MTQPLSAIPNGAAVMIDANIVVYALFPQSRYYQACKTLLERGARGEVFLNLTVTSAADVVHRAMVLEVIAQGVHTISAQAVSYPKQNPQAVQELTRYKTILRDITQARMNILPLTYRDLHGSRMYRERYGLMMNDSLVAGVMQRERIVHLATNDRDYAQIPQVSVYVP